MTTPTSLDERFPLRGALHLTDTELAVADLRRWQAALPAVIDVLREWCADHRLVLDAVPADAIIRRLPDEGAVETEVYLRGDDGRRLVAEGEPVRGDWRADGLQVVAPWPEDLWALTSTGARP